MINDYFRPVRHKYPIDFALELIVELSGKTERQCRKMLDERIWPYNPAMKKLEPNPAKRTPKPKLKPAQIVQPRFERLWAAFVGRPFSLAEASEMLQIPLSSTCWTMQHLTKRGLCERVRRGTYRLKEPFVRTDIHDAGTSKPGRQGDTDVLLDL